MFFSNTTPVKHHEDVPITFVLLALVNINVLSVVYMPFMYLFNMMCYNTQSTICTAKAYCI